MVKATQAQEMSKFLANSLKTKGVKQSEILELLSQFEGYKDWNTFKALDTTTVSKESDWTKSEYVHIDNGGYFFSYNSKCSLLKIENSFFGYSNNIIKVKMTKKEIGKLIYAMENYETNVKTHIDFNGNNSFLQEGNGWSIEGYNLIFHTDSAVMDLGLTHITAMIQKLKTIQEAI